MIKDRLNNSKTYYNLSEAIQKGFDWLQKNDLINISDGKYEIDGKNIYANVQTYNTKIEAKYESHRDYIDIQYMIQGVEKIGVTDLSNCKTTIEYDSETDLEFFDTLTEEEYFKLNEGDFMIFFPQDAHKPSIAIDQPTMVKKVVVKVKI